MTVHGRGNGLDIVDMCDSIEQDPNEYAKAVDADGVLDLDPTAKRLTSYWKEPDLRETKDPSINLIVR